MPVRKTSLADKLRTLSAIKVLNAPKHLVRSISSPIFKYALAAKNIYRIINKIASIWPKNMLGYLSLDIIYSSKLIASVPQPARTARFSKQLDNARGQISVGVFAPDGGYCLQLTEE